MSTSPIVCLAAIGLFLSATPAHAQFDDCGDEFLELWVSPSEGMDPAQCSFDPCLARNASQCDPDAEACRAEALARAGDPNQPYGTLNAAVHGAWLALCPSAGSGYTEALVHAGPGVYSPETNLPENAESLPIIMRSDVHVQGVGAKETVLRGVTDPANQVACYEVRFPWNPDGPNSNEDPHRPSRLLVDFTYVVLEGPDDPGPFIDGFTFQGGDIQVHVATEIAHKAGIVSNCVFDMRHAWTTQQGVGPVLGPYFGVLAVNTYFGEDGIEYHDTKLQVINNTFIQGWTATDSNGQEFIEVARDENVAICNSNDPSPMCDFPVCNEDPVPTLRGVGNLSVQNNLIRSLEVEPRTAMLGIDQGDAHASQGTLIGATNAFSPLLVGNVSVGLGHFFSGAESIPDFAVRLLPDDNPDDEYPAVDPGFVGEMLNNFYGPLQTFRVRDWRLLPSSPLVDQGSSPVDDPGDPPDPMECQDGELTAVNGTTYMEYGRKRIFDFDGEVHGNPRLVGDDVDIGFDEADTLCVAGSYGNDSKNHYLGLSGETPDGQMLRTYILPEFATPMDDASFEVIAQLAPYPLMPMAWTNMPGTLMFPQSIFIGPTFIGFRWIIQGPGFRRVGPFGAAPPGYVNPLDGMPHDFRAFQVDYPEPGNPRYLSEQAGYYPGPQLDPVLSNLQSEIL